MLLFPQLSVQITVCRCHIGESCIQYSWKRLPFHHILCCLCCHILPFLLFVLYSPCSDMLSLNLTLNSPIGAHILRWSSTCNTNVCIIVLQRICRRPYLIVANWKMKNFPLLRNPGLSSSGWKGFILGIWRCKLINLVLIPNYVYRRYLCVLTISSSSIQQKTCLHTPSPYFWALYSLTVDGCDKPFLESAVHVFFLVIALEVLLVLLFCNGTVTVR